MTYSQNQMILSKSQRPRNQSKNLTILLIFMLFSSVVSQCPAGTTGFNCQSCITGCDVCDTSITTCDTCTKKYYLDSATTTCLQCPSNCLDCSTPFECTTCTPGYDTYTDSSGFQACEFVWWKWFLIIFGILFFFFLVGLLIWWIRQKLSEEDKENQEIQYEMKVENTESNVD